VEILAGHLDFPCEEEEPQAQHCLFALILTFLHVGLSGMTELQRIATDPFFSFKSL